MDSQFRVNQLYASREVTIRDVCCRAHRHGWGAEESSSGHELVFMRAGVFTKRVGKAELVADANHALFFNRDEVYHVAHPVDGGDECTVFEFEPALAQEIVTAREPRAAERPERPFECTHVLSSQPLFLRCQRLRQRLHAGARNPLMTEELALELLAAAVREAGLRSAKPAAARPDTAAARHQLVQAAQFMLTQTLGEKLGLPDLARRLHSSPFHLARLFRTATGLAIHQYRHRLRLRTALERVVAGEDDLTRLALELGFSSHSHLTDAFKAAFGLPPSACRHRASRKWLREVSKNLEVAVAAAV